MNKYIIIEEMILRLAGQSQQVPHVHFLSLISFTGTRAPQIDLLASEWLHSPVGESTASASQRSWVGILLKTLKKKKTFQCTYETH